jgi:hypothetical protein
MGNNNNNNNAKWINKDVLVEISYLFYLITCLALPTQGNSKMLK